MLSGGLSSQDVSTISQDHATTVEPFLADQIEVLKGPATLLYGSGAIGGVVNIVDGRIAERRLDETFKGRAELRYDSVNRGRTAMARVDASGADGALVLHADGVYRDQDDYDTPDGEQSNSFVETRAGALGASYIGADGFIGFSASRYDNRYGNPGEPGDPSAGEAGVSLGVIFGLVFLICGLAPDEAIPSDELFYSIVHPEDQKRVRAETDEAILERSFSLISHRLLLKDGSVRWVIGRCQIERDEKGQALRALGTIQDVTDQKEAEIERETLAKSSVWPSG